MPTLTVLTATYNRGLLLSKCYESLCRQTCKDFEWLIVDDGSVDNTKEVVGKLGEKSVFPIFYIRKGNGGKHTALNYSHPYIHGRYLLMLDDDDVLTPDAVETVLKDWKLYDSNKKIGCLSYQKGGRDLKPLVKWGEKNPILSNTIDFRVNACRNGDCAEVIRTKMFLEYPAPVFDGERFLPEDFLWINSAFKYDTVYISKIIYLCEYREDGLTKTKNLNRFKNPLGGMYTCNLYFNSQISVYVQLKKAILYDCYALYTGKLIANLKKSKGVIVCILSLPISCFLLKYWLWRSDR